MKYKFPEGFLWGTAVSSYQVEGNNTKSDWWQWEQKEKTEEKSGVACDYYHLFKKDHDSLEELGCRAFRLSIEWGRVEFDEGKFSQKEFAHYREILLDLKKRNIKIQLTLWWWTSPIWFSEKYGFHNKKSVELFMRYVEKVVDELGDLVDLYQIFNEPMVPLGQGYLGGVFPPGYRSPIKFFKAIKNVATAYRKSYDIVKKRYPNIPVGVSYLYNFYQSDGLNWTTFFLNKFSKWFRISLLDKKIKDKMDFVAVQYYRLGKIKFDWRKIKWDSKNQIYLGFTVEEDEKNIMKWISYPEGMYKVLMEVKESHNLPIYITENGVPTGTGLDDDERTKFINEHLRFVHKAILEGADVRGYNYWSLLDNFEWLYGYEPRFGLVEVNFSIKDKLTFNGKALERRPRASFYEYQKIIKDNGF